jgi:nucleoside phosphorylase
VVRLAADTIAIAVEMASEACFAATHGRGSGCAGFSAVAEWA